MCRIIYQGDAIHVMLTRLGERQPAAKDGARGGGGVLGLHFARVEARDAEPLGHGPRARDVALDERDLVQLPDGLEDHRDEPSSGDESERAREMGR